jgi:hypothetical protein
MNRVCTAVLVGLVLLAGAFTSTVLAEKTAITVNPIQDHRLNESFYINGTVSGEATAVNITVVQKSWYDAQKLLTEQSGSSDNHASCDEKEGTCMITTFRDDGMPSRITYPLYPDLHTQDISINGTGGKGTWEYLFDQTGNTTEKPGVYIVAVTVPGEQQTTTSTFTLKK